MRLTDDEISCIATWEEIQAGFGRDDPATSARIEAIVAQLNSSDHCRAKVLQQDGISNYFVICVIPSVHTWSHLEPCRKVDGLLINLSACAPVGVVGPGRFVIEGVGFERMDIDQVIDPSALNGTTAECVVETLRHHSYELLTKAEVEMLLPAGVVAWEYCYGKAPWNRRFHALFADTD